MLCPVSMDLCLRACKQNLKGIFSWKPLEHWKNKSTAALGLYNTVKLKSWKVIPYFGGTVTQCVFFNSFGVFLWQGWESQRAWQSSQATRKAGKQCLLFGSWENCDHHCLWDSSWGGEGVLGVLKCLGIPIASLLFGWGRGNMRHLPYVRIPIMKGRDMSFCVLISGMLFH